METTGKSKAPAKKADKVISVQEFKQMKADISKKRKADGKDNVQFSLTDTFEVKFTKAFKGIPKDKEMRVSDFMYQYYMENKCVEKIN